MEEPGNQTVMCTVFFMDIVEYSRKSVTEQILLKERFNSYLATAIQDVPITDRIILDTSDGAVITFLGDVEDALKSALSLRGSLLSEAPDAGKSLPVRMGINLGPVRLVRDANGQPNIVGDGINVAQLVMSFANANQILVSRSYYNAATRLSPQFAGMFLYQGSRTDRHVREHEVYAVGYRGDKSKQEELVVAKQVESPLATTVERAKSVWHSAATKLKSLIEHLMIRFMHATLQQRVLYVGAVVTILVLLIILAVKLVDPHKAGMTSNRTDKQSSNESRITSAVAPESSVQTNPGGNGNNNKQTQVSGGSQQKAVESKVVAPKPKFKPKSEPKAEPRLELKPNANHPESRPKAKVQDNAVEKAAVAAPSGNSDAYISVNCKEGTEIFVDGVRKGRISSGLLSIPIAPGKHAVIVSHPRAGIFSQDIAIDAGKTVRLNPSFCN